MKHIVRSVKPHGLPFVFQGEMDSSAEVVDPSTVRVFNLFTNGEGDEVVHSELISKKGSKFKNSVAIRLTRQYRHYVK